MVAAGSSASKPEEVKRLPGGKVKKKVRISKDSFAINMILTCLEIIKDIGLGVCAVTLRLHKHFKILFLYLILQASH